MTIFVVIFSIIVHPVHFFISIFGTIDNTLFCAIDSFSFYNGPANFFDAIDLTDIIIFFCNNAIMIFFSIGNVSLPSIELFGFVFCVVIGTLFVIYNIEVFTLDNAFFCVIDVFGPDACTINVSFAAL